MAKGIIGYICGVNLKGGQNRKIQLLFIIVFLNVGYNGFTNYKSTYDR